MAACIADGELSPGDTTSLSLLLDAGAGACPHEEGRDAGVDSGYSSGPSRSVSESSCTSASGPVDSWAVRTVFPSTMFASLSPWPAFGIWSPASEDDYILQRPPHDVDEKVSSQRSSSVSSGSLSSVYSCSESSDCEEWGSFLSWKPMPTPEEAEALQLIREQEEAVIHERAALKKETKKRKYFETVRQRKKRLNDFENLRQRCQKLLNELSQ